MSTQVPARSLGERGSPWANGFTVLAAALMMVAGVWHVIAGVAALVHDDVYVATPRYIYSFDLTVWGWVHLLTGVVVGVAGFAVLKGQMWGRVVGVVAACLSMIANFAFLPYYPLWSLLIIAMDIGIVWALATYRRDPL